jgi:hypothetical protein
MTYPSQPPRFDPDKATKRKAAVARAIPLNADDPAYRHWVDVRGIPAEVVLTCRDLLLLRPPILEHSKTEFGAISLLRPAPDAEPTGCEITFIDRRGAKTSDRLTWAFVARGCVDAWFWAGGSGERVIACEGYGAKPLAALATGVPGAVVGWGPRSWLASKAKLPMTVKRMLIAPDRRPDETEVGEDGKPLHEGHDRDTRRGADRWLGELGDDAVDLAADPGLLGKDLDEVLRAHGVDAVRGLLERTTRAKLSEDGWIKRLADMSSLEYEQQRADLARDLGGIRLSALDELRKKGQAAGSKDDDAARSRLIAIALGSDLFRDDGGDGYSCIELEDGGLRTFKIESDAFTDWLLTAYGNQYPTTVSGHQIPGTVSASTLTDAKRAILAMARQGDTRAVFLRLGWGGDRLYLDMATDAPRALEVTAAGWSVVVDPPVHLIYAAPAKPLPVPAPAPRNAVLRQLRRFFGFRLKDDRLILLIGVMMAALMPRGPYPILILSGEQGSGKTSRSRFIKLAVDPTKASVRGRPKSAEDLAISVWRSWLGLFDNLSKLDQEMSDWLCRLSEGAGLPKRKLYSDSDEILIEAARPIMLTAIPDIAQSGDVIDRAILVRCDPMPRKITEQVLLDEFDAFRPALLNYLIEAASCALRRYPEMATTHDGLRRGDWARWVEAAAPALGLPEGAFLTAYLRNQEQAVRLALELDSVAAAVLEYMRDKREVEVTATQLHSALETIARSQHSGRLPLDWPSMTHHFSGRLRRVSPGLRRVGIEVVNRHGMVGSILRLTNLPHAQRTSYPGSASSASSAPGNGEAHDAHDAHDADFAGPDGRAREASHPGNGLDQTVDEVLAGTRCGFCACLINGEAAEQIGDRWFHSDACASEHGKKAEPAPSPLSSPPPPKKSRVRRGKST